MTTRTVTAILLCTLLTALISAPVQAAKDYLAENYSVQVDIQPGGDLLVTETVTFRFEGGPFSYVFREISRRGTDGLEILSASMDGSSIAPGGSAGQVEIEDGDPVNVTWHFEPVSDSTHVFVLNYRVEGAVQSLEEDLLSWQVIPEEHDYVIEAAAVTLTYPAGIQPIETPSLDEPFEVGHLDNGVRLETGRLLESQGLALTARFASGSLVSSPPGWQVSEEASDALARQAFPIGLGAFLMTGIIGLVMVIASARSFRREGHIPVSVTQRVTVLPRDLAPALAARLAATSTPFLGTLFDLARRGRVEFREGPRQWGRNTFNIIHHPSSEALAPHEQVLLSTLFKKGNEVPLDGIAHLAYTGAFTQALDQELTGMGLRDPRRISRKNSLTLWNGVATALGICLAGAGLLLVILPPGDLPWLTLTGAGIIGLGAAGTTVGLIGLIVVALISPLSNEGEHQADLWKRFCGYLHAITQGKEAGIQSPVFETYLPYAAAFGIASDWGKHFKSMPDVPIPAWLGSMHGSLDDGSFATILAVLTAADSSASVATGGSDGGGASSGGGASGAG